MGLCSSSTLYIYFFFLFRGTHGEPSSSSRNSIVEQEDLDEAPPGGERWPETEEERERRESWEDTQPDAAEAAADAANQQAESAADAAADAADEEAMAFAPAAALPAALRTKSVPARVQQVQESTVQHCKSRVKEWKTQHRSSHPNTPPWKGSVANATGKPQQANSAKAVPRARLPSNPPTIVVADEAVEPASKLTYNCFTIGWQACGAKDCDDFTELMSSGPHCVENRARVQSNALVRPDPSQIRHPP